MSLKVNEVISYWGSGIHQFTILLLLLLLITVYYDMSDISDLCNDS